LGDGGIALGGVRERCGGIRSGSGNFDLGRRLDTGEFGRPIMAEPATAEEKEYAKDKKANHQKQKGIASRRLGGSPGDARDIRHVRPKAGGWSIVGHRNRMIVLVRGSVSNTSCVFSRGGRKSLRKGKLC